MKTKVPFSVAALLLAMLFVSTATASADMYWVGPLQAEGIGATEPEAFADAMDVLIEYIESVDDGLTGGDYVMGYIVMGSSYDGLVCTVTYHIFIWDEP